MWLDSDGEITLTQLVYTKKNMNKTYLNDNNIGNVFCNIL